MIGRRAVIVAALFVALAAAACSSGSGSSNTSSAYGGSNTTTTTAVPTPTTAAPAATGTATVAAGDSKLGKVAVDAQGHTLYTFSNDQGTTSSCTASCRGTWPPVVDGGAKATAGTGLDATKLTTAVQSDGTRQVAYNGHLLYTYAGDRAVGDTNGQGIGGVWFAVTAAGDKAA